MPGLFSRFQVLLFISLLVLGSAGCSRGTMASGTVAEHGLSGPVPSNVTGVSQGLDGSGRRSHLADPDEKISVKEQLFLMKKELGVMKRENDLLRGRLSWLQQDLSLALAEIDNLQAKLAALLQPDPGQPKPPEIYEVEDGDTLSSIAGRKDIYGDPSQWERISEANEGVVTDPNSLQPGSKLVIPR